MARRRQADWFWQIGTELQSLSEELLHGALNSPVTARRFWEPRVDVCETEDTIVVIAEIAGMDPEAISVSFSPDRKSLILRGSRSEHEPEQSKRTRCYQLEIYYGDFLREVPLPNIPIDVDRITANYRSGMLTITVPKSELPAVSRTIPVVEG